MSDLMREPVPGPEGIAPMVKTYAELNAAHYAIVTKLETQLAERDERIRVLEGTLRQIAAGSNEPMWSMMAQAVLVKPEAAE